MRNFVKYSLLLLNLVLASLLAASRLIPYSNPYEYSFLGLLGFFTPVLFCLQLFFLLLWLFSRKFLYLFVPLSAMAYSWSVVHVFFAVHNPEDNRPSGSPKEFSVMSYNVRLLDLYHWNEDKDSRKKLIAFLHKQNPTILCLQEFYSGEDKKNPNNIRAIQQACGYEYMAECNMYVTKRGKWGSILFSHLPIAGTKNYEMDVQGNNLLQRADIVFDADTFSVYNVHLKSNRLSKSESELVNQKDVPDFSDSNLSASKSIFRKLQDNAVNRGLEADIAAAAIAQQGKPAIVCGDLNDIPCSYVYFKLRDILRDAFLDKGLGLGYTFRGSLPVFRIDYLFYHPAFTLNQFNTLSVPFSDHNPLIARFSLPEKTNSP